MSTRLSQITVGLASVADGYNHWTEAHEALQRRDDACIDVDYGLFARNGEIFDRVIFFDGLLAEPWAWSAADPRAEPSSSFLDKALLDRVRRVVAKQPLGARQAFDTATVIDGHLASSYGASGVSWETSDGYVRPPVASQAGYHSSGRRSRSQD